MLFKAHHHWLLQRLSATLLVFLYPLLLLCFYEQRSFSYEKLILSLQSPYTFMLVLFTVMIAIYHAILGLVVIVEDYVTGSFARSMILIFLKCFALILCVFVSFFLVKIKMLEVSL